MWFLSCFHWIVLYWYLTWFGFIFFKLLLVLWFLMSCGWPLFFNNESHCYVPCFGWSSLIRRGQSRRPPPVPWLLPTFTTNKLPADTPPLMFNCFENRQRGSWFQESVLFHSHHFSGSSWLLNFGGLVGLLAANQNTGRLSRVWSSAKDQFKEWQVGGWQEIDICGGGGDRFEYVFQFHSLEFCSKSVSHVNSSSSPFKLEGGRIGVVT